MFDLKWSIRSADINFSALTPSQIVNHFAMSSKLTTKVGLLHVLRDMRWSGDMDAHRAFPRCYDLASDAEVALFREVCPRQQC